MSIVLKGNFGTYFCEFICKSHDNDGKQYSFRKHNNIKKHDFYRVVGIWNRGIQNPLTLSEFNEREFTLVCFGQYNGKDARERLQPVREILSTIGMNKMGVLKYPEQPIVACYVFESVHNVDTLESEVQAIQELSKNGVASKIEGFIIHLCAHKYAIPLVFGGPFVKYRTIFMFKLKNQHFETLTVIGIESNGRFRLDIGNEQITSIPVLHDELRDDLKAAINYGRIVHVRALVINWYICYNEARFVFIMHECTKFTLKDAPDQEDESLTCIGCKREVYSTDISVRDSDGELWHVSCCMDHVIEDDDTDMTEDPSSPTDCITGYMTEDQSKSEEDATAITISIRVKEERGNCALCRKPVTTADRRFIWPLSRGGYVHAECDWESNSF